MDCLFCGENRKMTKEHILPRWMREEFPELAREPVYSGSRFEYDSPASNGPKERIEGGRKQGGPFTRQAPVVCGSCNGGWMSGLETAVRKPLAQMIKGLPVALTPEHQKTVALWSAMKLMVAYFNKHYGGKRPPLEVIAIEDPRALYRNKALGSRMVMTLARYQPTPTQREPFHRIVFERMDHGGGKHSYQMVLKIDSFVAKLIRVAEGLPMHPLPPALHDAVVVHPGSGPVQWPPRCDVFAGEEWERYAYLPDETGVQPR